MQAFLIAIIVSLTTYAGVSPINSKVLSSFEDQDKVDVLVILKNQADLTKAREIKDRNTRLQFVYDQLRNIALDTQIDLLEFLEEENLSYQSFHIVNAIAVNKINKDQLDKLVQLDTVGSVEANPEVSLQTIVEKESLVPQTVFTITENLRQIGVEKVWQMGFRGQGIVVAGQDTGYDWQHPALIAQYRGSNAMTVSHKYNWHDAIHAPLRNKAASDCGYNSEVPCDDDTHGTHTMGTMVGLEKATQANPIGAAPDAQWIGCRNMDRGDGRPSTYLECFEFFLAPYGYGENPKLDGKPEYAPHIINNSWGCPRSEGCTGDEFIQAIENLHAAGVLVVVSAGNDGSRCGSLTTAPGFYSGRLISVAAYDHRNMNIAYFSSRGPSSWNGGVGANITAPGSGIRSSVPNGRYSSMSGTSMSGPHVAGAIALLWSARPSLIGQIEETRSLIERTAMPKTSSQSCGDYPGLSIPNAVFGYGIIDVSEAVKAVQE
ncbi:MAG: S8 family serine peptidase [Oligoflexia bacterium]|nr:S8 family serine peptidase [Oligoflexia bacterium]